MPARIQNVSTYDNGYRETGRLEQASYAYFIRFICCNNFTNLKAAAKKPIDALKLSHFNKICTAISTQITDAKK